MSSEADNSLTSAGDRRAHRRYDIELDLQYVARTGQKVVTTGAGSSCNISSAGLLFRGGEQLQLGTWVVTGLHWRFAQERDAPRLLVVAGPVIRSTPQETAIAISGYEFLRGESFPPSSLKSTLRARPARRISESGSPGLTRTRRLVLLLDNDLPRDVIRAVLERHGYSVRAVDQEGAERILKDGRVRVELAIAGDPDRLPPNIGNLPVILIMDREATRPNRHAHRERRVIVLSKPLIYAEFLAAVRQLSSSGFQSPASQNPTE